MSLVWRSHFVVVRGSDIQCWHALQVSTALMLIKDISDPNRFFLMRQAIALFLSVAKKYTCYGNVLINDKDGTRSQYG